MKAPPLDQALAHIERHGTTRSNALATLLGISQRKVIHLLAPAVENGQLVTCDIRVPGQPPMVDYRLAADVAPFKVFRVNPQRTAEPPPRRGRPRKSVTPTERKSP